MLDSKLKQQLEVYLARVTEPVEIVAALDDSDAAREMRALLGDIAALSSRVTLIERNDGADRVPSFRISRVGADMGLQFAGLPMGHEFTSLVLALLQAGGHAPKVDAAVIEQIRALDRDLDFEVYISLSCQNCPEVVQALNLMAVLNPRVRTTMIDGALYQQEVATRQIMAVPSVYLNGEPFAQGRMTVEEILAKVDSGTGDRQARVIAGKEPFDVLVVGGGPAGAAAAIYAARKGIRTGIVTERLGGQVLDTMGIENFISVKETEGPKLAAALESHVRGHDIDVVNLQRAEALLPAGEDGLHTVRLASGVALRSRSVVLSTGARWREMNVPGERQYRGRGVAYCPHCDGPLF
jgi:alkyl hydroperoxide reductase subunit F